MTRQSDSTKPNQLSRIPGLPDELIERLAETLMQSLDKELDDPSDFAAFERGVLDVGNEFCRQALKKNSKQ